jgi:hypothetical protein
LSVTAGFAIPGGSAVSADVEEAPSSSVLEDQGVQGSRADALSVIADSDLQAPHGVSLMGSGDLGEASAVLEDSVIRALEVALTPAAASAAARSAFPEEDAWPLDRPVGAEGASGSGIWIAWGHPHPAIQIQKP